MWNVKFELSTNYEWGTWLMFYYYYDSQKTMQVLRKHPVSCKKYKYFNTQFEQPKFRYIANIIFSLI